MPDINIIAINPRTRRVTFDFNVFPVRARNMEALLQLCAKTILTNPGFDKFVPKYGGGLPAYAGKNFSLSDIPKIQADVAIIIRNSEEQILMEQMNKPITDQERLRSLTLIAITYLEEEGSLDVRVLVTSDAGESQDISLANQLRIKRTEYA